MLCNPILCRIPFLALLLFATSASGEQNNLIRFDRFFGGPLHKTAEPYTLAGEITYIGTGTFESVYLNWKIGDEGEIHTTLFDEIYINPQIPFRFQNPEKWIPEQPGEYTLHMWFSGINGEDPDVPASTTLEFQVEVYDQLVERQLVLLESFSSINCGSCATVTPVLRALIDNNPERYAQIYYHPNGYEGSPLYLFNPKDQDLRRDHYGVFYTPVSAVGGLYFGGSEGVEEQFFEMELGKWSGFDLNGEWFVHDTDIYFHLQGEAYINLDDPEKDLRLLVAAVQDSVFFEEAPGSNNEKEFYSAMRFFAPDANGIRLTAEHQDSIDISLSSRWYPELETDRMTLVLFVQDLYSSEIYQAVRMDYHQFMDPEEPDDPTYVNQAVAEPFRVYPNPASDLLVVSSSAGIAVDQLILYDNNGNVAINSSSIAEGENTIDLTGLRPGLYILNVVSDQNSYIYKVSVIQ